MRMYFRTDYYADVGIDEVVGLKRGITYEVVDSVLQYNLSNPVNSNCLASTASLKAVSILNL